LPVNYAKGILKEHLHCRESASLFDVSHMGQIIIKGADRLKLLQKSTVGNTDSTYIDKSGKSTGPLT
jgi:glycine cleavage system aminomethyltransferase T